MGPGTDPNTAPGFAVGGYYQNALASTGAQHWFYTQADRNGQMTVHLDVPDSTAVDYDLYVYRYEPSTGNLYNFKSSTRNAGAAEHISFITSIGSYYFIHVQSYQGGGSSSYYYLHIEMAETATLDAGEIDDFPDNARTLTPILNNVTSNTGGLSMRTDEDFFKFTAVGTGAAINFYPTDVNNTNIVADLYQLNGTALNYMGLLPERGSYPLSTTTGATYYLHVHNADNKILSSNSDYTLGVNSFNYNASLTNASIVGRNVSGSEILYIANEKLYQNSSFLMNATGGGLEPICHYHFEEPVSTYRKAVHDSHAVSPVLEVYPISYTVYGSGSGVSSMSNALAIRIRKDDNDLGVYYKNSKYSFQDPDTGETTEDLRRYSEAYYAEGSYILDLSDNKVKDLASWSGNGFYNGYFDRHSFVITRK